MMEVTDFNQDDVLAGMSFHPPQVSSPIKLTRKLNENIQAKEGNILKSHKLVNNYDTFEMIESNIDDYIDRVDNQFAGKTVRGRDFNQDIDLVISQTYQVMNQIPQSISSHEEGDRHIKQLSQCIRKIVSLVQVQKQDITNLKIENQQKTIQIKNLQFENNQLNLSNQDDKNKVEELYQKNQELKRRNLQLKTNDSKKQTNLLQTNQRLLHENGLLREKLIKYRDLYHKQLKNNKIYGENKQERGHEHECELEPENGCKAIGNKLLQLKYDNDKQTENKVNLSTSEEQNQSIQQLLHQLNQALNKKVEKDKANHQLDSNLASDDSKLAEAKADNASIEHQGENFRKSNHDNKYENFTPLHRNEIDTNVKYASEHNDENDEKDENDESIIDKLADLINQKNQKINQLRSSKCNCQLPICSTCKHNVPSDLNINDTLHIAGEYKWII